jgi:transposase
VEFLKKLLTRMREKKQIMYMDETSSHLWEKISSVWMPKDEFIQFRLNKDRGKSMTIIGAICTQWPMMKYYVCAKTNVVCVMEFFNLLKGHVQKGSVMVLDNHTAHRSQKVRDLAFKLGIELLFLPPTASELNPIENMWSYFKRKWRQMLYDSSLTITEKNSKVYVSEALHSIAKHGPSLAEGPMSHMLTWCKAELEKEESFIISD